MKTIADSVHLQNAVYSFNGLCTFVELEEIPWFPMGLLFITVWSGSLLGRYKYKVQRVKIKQRFYDSAVSLFLFLIIFWTRQIIIAIYGVTLLTDLVVLQLLLFQCFSIVDPIFRRPDIQFYTTNLHKRFNFLFPKNHNLKIDIGSGRPTNLVTKGKQGYLNPRGGTPV